MVLLETEIWPGLLQALKQQQCKTIIINARMTARSLNRYLVWPSIWPPIRPDRILAISPADADRFMQLFGPQAVEIMPNIKFDRVASSTTIATNRNPLKNLIPDTLSFVVLASIRRQEESQVGQLVDAILHSRPQTVVGLFPRHMHRVKAWQEILDRAGIQWSLRSEARGPTTIGSVILWDTFGELQQAYGLCQAAFVGGSLAPLGGQNFLEAMMCGTRPVMGPSWENFLWIGDEIIDSGLLRVVDNWQAAAAQLIKDMDHPAPRDEIISRSLGYIKNRRGGTAQACSAIIDLMADRE
jgi:3-deoxy-D-manno-octulosonic-acid transferase